MHNTTKKARIKKSLWFMARVTFIWFISFCALGSVLMASSVKSQGLENTRVQLSLKESKLGTVFSMLEQQSDFTFSYSHEIGNRKINGITTNQSLAKLLEELGKQYQLKFSPFNHIIAVSSLPPPRQPGKISGKVIDENGAGLPGASLKVSPTGAVVQSSVDGSYQISLPPGTYSMEVSYISYQKQKISGIVVGEGKNTILDIAMKPGSKALNEVVISTDYKRASVEGLYARQKNNPALTDGISAAQIALTPDKNIGEVLKRISGLSTVDNKYIVVRGLSERYNQSVLNGQVMPSTELNRKNFSFDLIPANMVDNVTVSKSITPDRSAEFGGGLVEVNTIDIPTENFLNLSVGSTYYDKATGKDFLTVPLEGKEYFGQVADHRKLLGSFDWKSTTEIANKFEASGNDLSYFKNNFAVTRMKAPVSPNFQASIGRLLHPEKKDSELGFVASLSYRNTLQTSDILIGRDGYVGFTDNGTNENSSFNGKSYNFSTNLGGMAGIGFRNGNNRIGFQTLYLRTLEQKLILGTGAARDNIGAPAFSYFDITSQTDLWQSQLKGEYNSNRAQTKINYMLSYLTLNRQKPDNKNLFANYIHTNPDQPNEYSINRPQSAGISEGTLRSWSRSYEKDLGWDVSLTQPFKFNVFDIPANNKFKVGYAGWYKDRFFFVMNTSSYTKIADNYTPLGQVFSPENLERVGVSAFKDDYHRNAQLHAFYGMLDNRIAEKWRLVWGVRAEYYNLNKANVNLDKSMESFKGALDYSALYNREPNLRWFPSANLTYSMNKTMNFRLAYSKSIIRPDLRELSFFKEYDFELGGEYSGNYVVSTILDNYDLKYEWFTGAGEVISASVFYKKMKYPMEIKYEPNAKTFTLLNNKEATNYGFEIEARKSFAFTGYPLLKNITLYSNLTALKASLVPMGLGMNLSDDKKSVVVEEVLGDKQNRPQQGASNLIVNGGFYYDTKLFSFSMAYNYTSNRIQLTQTFTKDSRWEKPMTTLDGQLNFHLLRNKLDAKFNVTNLLNGSTIVYFNTPIATNKEKPEPSSKDLRYQKGEDEILYRNTPGRSYGLSLNYRF